MSYISNLEPHVIDDLREYLKSDFRAFCRFAFKIQTGFSMIDVDYYDVVYEVVQKAIDREETRIIITIPPRAGKTQILAIFLPLFAWVRSPHAQNFITSFNKDVLAESSGYIRTVMSDPDFQTVFPDVIIDNNKKSVERLGTMSGGVTHAVISAGNVTGKGAGTLSEGFSGLFVIDDIIKPDDCRYPSKRDAINDRYTGTLISRLASPQTPMVIIMQRLHADDLVGYLLKGGTDDDYLWLNIPGLIRKETGSQEWYDNQIKRHGYTNAIPYLYELERDDYDSEGDSSFWSMRKTVQQLKGMRAKNNYMFTTQFMGEPASIGTTPVKYEMMRTYQGDAREVYEFTTCWMTADTAMTKEDYSDYTVVCYWGKTDKGELVLIDFIRAKWEVPELMGDPSKGDLGVVREFWNKHNNYDPNYPAMLPIGMYMEHKSSGLFLNQQFERDGTVHIIEVPRDGTKANDKYTRFAVAIPYFGQGRIHFPADHAQCNEVIQECVGMTAIGNNTGHDDFCDNVADAAVVCWEGQMMDYSTWS